ncbi:MAG: RecQ family ATP-dependent DNA helicase, partial [Planctomycetota bacterium]
KDVDDMSSKLKAKGYKVAPYHAGMTAHDRKKNQDRFIKEKVDIIVATVAFGMGIDKSNVRYVIHTGMPKSLEHYQQESGRAGRDGLEAECCLFFSGGDYGVWKSLCRDMSPQANEIAMIKLSHMYNYCTGGTCRHKVILRYFGQDIDKDDCAASDICLGEIDYIEDALVIAQKIISCVARLEQRFGGGYTALVLTGSQDKRILENYHDKLSTHGLLSEHPKRNVHNWIEQLVGQDFLEKDGEYNVLNITSTGWDLLKGLETPRLLKPAEKPAKVSKVAADSWEGVDKELFESLRILRANIAGKKRLPAFMARKRPMTPDAFLQVTGVGEKKRKQYSEAFIGVIEQYCRQKSIATDVGIVIDSN